MRVCATTATKLAVHNWLNTPTFAGQKSLYYDHFLLFWWLLGGFVCFRFHWIAPRLAHARNSGTFKVDGGAFERAVSSASPSSRDAELHVRQHPISRFFGSVRAYEKNVLVYKWFGGSQTAVTE